MNKKMLKITGVIAGFLLLIAAGTNNRFFEISKNLEIFVNAYKILNDEHAEGTDPSKLMRIALDSMLLQQDPYTNYISEAEMETYRFLENPTKYGTIGASVMLRNGNIYLKEVYEGLGADKSGLRQGDQILEVDGESVKGRTAEEVDMKLRGAINGKATLKLIREGKSDPIEVTIKLANNEPKNVPYYGMVDDETGYILLTIFTQNAAEHINDAFKKLRTEHNIKKLILDLRDNGGGLLNEAVDIVNLFVPRNQEIVSTRSKIAEWDKSFKTQNEPVDLDIPLVVLINGHSASASEIVSGSLQDLDRAVLVGQRSFGKGLVQNTFDIGYNSKVKVTTARYHTPSGRCIQAVRYVKGKPVELEEQNKKAFKTKNGRTVYDGTAVMPDYKVELESKSSLIKALKDQHVIFDFATKYRNTHDSIEKPGKFNLGDQGFEDFKNYLASINFKYQTESAQKLDVFEKALKEDQYQNEAMAASIANIKNKIETEKQRDLEKQKEAILRELEGEIVSRFYFEGGRAEVRLHRDPEVKAALMLFKDTRKYNNLLSPR